MISVKRNFNHKYMLKLGLLSAGALLCLLPLLSLPLIAEASTKPRTTQVAALNDCFNDISEGFSVETTNYYVGICYKQNGVFYVGRSKQGNGRIFLPAFSNKAKNVYVAQNASYTYTLDLKNNQLVIKSPNGKISTEQVLQVIDS